MTLNEYQKQAMTTLNPELSKKDVLINGVMGLCGEAGEAIDIVKKHLAQGHDLDREGLIKELGEESYQYCKEKFDVRKVNRTLLAHLDIQKTEE